MLRIYYFDSALIYDATTDARRADLSATYLRN